MKNRIGIFGGSFDPVHNGHIHVVTSFLGSGLIDTILVLLTPNPPHKQDAFQTDFTHRFEMLRLAFQTRKNVHVSMLEVNLPVPSYSLQTVNYLQKKHPETLFYLCLGEDSLYDFHTWHRYEEILERVDLLVAERPGFDSSDIDPEILEHVVFVDHTPVDISSTGLREWDRIQHQNVPGPVKEYIRKHGLYKP